MLRCRYLGCEVKHFFRFKFLGIDVVYFSPNSEQLNQQKLRCARFDVPLTGLCEQGFHVVRLNRLQLLSCKFVTILCYPTCSCPSNRHTQAAV